MLPARHQHLSRDGGGHTAEAAGSWGPGSKPAGTRGYPMTRDSKTDWEWRLLSGVIRSGPWLQRRARTDVWRPTPLVRHSTRKTSSLGDRQLRSPGLPSTNILSGLCPNRTRARRWSVSTGTGLNLAVWKGWCDSPLGTECSGTCRVVGCGPVTSLRAARGWAGWTAQQEGAAVVSPQRPAPKWKGALRGHVGARPPPHPHWACKAKQRSICHTSQPQSSSDQRQRRGN